jgi:AcrR family transcriptional regulator
MKVTRAKKQENHDRFIEAFVAEVRAKNYADITLKDVARRAGLPEGSVYKYFASKEKLLLAYYSEKMERLRIEAETINAKANYGIVDKLQEILEFQIGQYKGEKDFLEKTFQPTFVAAGLMWSEVIAMRKVYVGIVGVVLKKAAEKNEIPQPVWSGVVDEIAWCHYMAVMTYWQRDKSKHHEDTSQFIDRTLQLFNALVSGQVLQQAQELVGFLINRHVLPLMVGLGMPQPNVTPMPNPKPQPKPRKKR